MVRFSFDYDDLESSLKLIKKMCKPVGKSLSANIRVAFVKEKENLCLLKILKFNQYVKADIKGEGTIEISILYMLKILQTYRGSKIFTIEAISDTQSLINGTFKVKTTNYFI